jgi:hypothetical protein
MTDAGSRSASPPVALRIVRPFADEDAMLAAEAAAFSRTGVVLIGAPSRPNGVVLRFEIALSDGTPAMRGEGRVVGFRPGNNDEESALMLRFTRLDVKSKALLDRAVALREERRSMAPPPRTSLAPSAATNEAPRESVRPARAPSEPAAAAETMAEGSPRTSVPPPRHSTPAIPIPDDDPEPAEEVDDADLAAADEADLTAAAPPVAAVPIEATASWQEESSGHHEPIAIDAEPPAAAPPSASSAAEVRSEATPPQAPQSRGPSVHRAKTAFVPTLDAEKRGEALERLRRRQAAKNAR